MHFRILGEIADAENRSDWVRYPRDCAPAEALRPRAVAEAQGHGRNELSSGEIVWAELHWYEATGIGRREFEIKRLL